MMEPLRACDATAEQLGFLIAGKRTASDAQFAGDSYE